jgi:hypothetical protein
MKLDEPKNKNYAAIVVQIKDLVELDNSDNLLGFPAFGYQAIVSKDTEIGTWGVIFPPETQLSEEYCRKNNLHRHGDRNEDPDKVGYLEDTRRVKALKLRGNRSDALFMPLESLVYTGVKLDELQEGDLFDTLGKHEICKKYLIKEPGVQRLDKNKSAKFRRVDNVAFPLHLDTDNYFRNCHTIPDEQFVTVTQKLHGTSVRVGRVKVARKLRWFEKLAKKVGVRVSEEEYDNIYGSRRVIKDANDPDQQGFYSTDVWTETGHQLDGIMPDDYMFYGEIIGWTSDGSAIQPNYTYNLPAKQNALYIYRIAHVSNGGRTVVDLSWDQVKLMCKDLGLNHVPELWSGFHRDFNADDWLDTRYFENGYPNAVPMSGSKKLVDEGVVVRVERLIPYCLKAKSPIFLGHETKLLDKGVVDLESAEV